MAYKCVECGHIFEAGEERIWREPHQEEMTGCPICLSAYEATAACTHCHGEYLPDELYTGGICKQCLIDSITPRKTARYVHNRKIEKPFYIGFYFNSACDDISDELLHLAKREFLSMAGFEALGSKNACTQKCVAFVSEDESALDDFAQWIEEGEP